MRWWRQAVPWICAVGLLGCVQTPPPPRAETADPAPTPYIARESDGGWGYLIEKLVQDGLPRDRVERIFLDDRLPEFDGLEFSLRPGESHAMYRGFLSPNRVDAARTCYDEHADTFRKTAERFHVDGSVLAAIIYVESGCGRNTGRSPILFRLARLAMANEPANLQRNINRLAMTGGVLDGEKAARARQRARYLEDTFYPEVKALFEIQRRTRVDPLAMKGSPSGAFGFPQFLPSSYVRYGVDGNGDGRVSLYDMDDAIASAGNYFKQKGWRPGLTDDEKRKVVWEYNRSDAYIDTVLLLATEIAAAEPPEVADDAR